MSGLAPTFHKVFQYTDPGLSHIDHGKADLIGDALKPKAAPVVNAPPTVSTAANLAQQQDDLRNRQRGVLSNIFAGGNTNAPAPAVATGTVLGG